jgi:mono/diheme cytochrome c family protein
MLVRLAGPVVVALAAAALVAAGHLAAQPAPDAKAKAAPVDFARDVRPILARHCLSCHGAEKQKGGLRLDRRADALRGGDSGKAVAPGDPAGSLLLKLVSGADPDGVMPPRGDRLTPAEVGVLRAWVEQGARWPDDGSAAANPADWWSLKPVTRPPVPVSPAVAGFVVRNPIDAFVLAMLRAKGLAPSPEADRRTLIRRLYFDLIGLPPTPEEVDAFAADPDPLAYEKLVDRLLASPHFGERWARHWLDVVHFGETHGYDKDKPRPNAWPYRDYVIRAFNADRPYSRFVREQIAGDVLYPGTADGVEALGFLAAGPWDFIGHAELPEDKIDGRVARHLDRDDFVSNTVGTFLSLTVHCAQCHNHKFDPIPQEDYYRLQAVFAAIDRTDRAYDPDPATAARRAELEAKRAAAAGRVARAEAAARAKAGPALADLDRQLAAAKKAPGARPAEHGYHAGIADRADRAKWVQVDLGESVSLDRVVLRPCHDDFNGIGAGFGFPVRFKVEVSDDAQFARPSTVAEHTDREFANPGLSPVRLAANGAKGRYVRLTATTLANRLPTDYILAVAELEAVDAAGVNRAAGKAVMALDSIEAPARWRRSNLTDGRYPTGTTTPPEEIATLTVRRAQLLESSLAPEAAADLKVATADREAADLELRKLPAARRTAFVGAVHTGSGTFVGTGANAGRPRPIHLLARGDVTRPGREVSPGPLSQLPGLPAAFDLPPDHAEGDRRAALARWVTDPRHPLTWRSGANRIWQYHFGRGIVETPNDFGRMGALPTHPELLDWLAAELRDHDSLKRLHRLIVTSSTYRQSAAANPAHERADADNRYLWRQNRRKLEAEVVRDAILWAAGKLDRTMGGPSFQDFVIERPEHSPHYQYHLHDPNDPKSHRRSVYRFVVRSKQQPFMAALDCADPSLAVDRRNQTITPQQALALLNNRLAVTMAGHLADRVRPLAADDGGRVAAAFRIALGRPPTAEERAALAEYASAHGLPAACRVVLNLNEFVFAD